MNLATPDQTQPSASAVTRPSRLIALAFGGKLPLAIALVVGCWLLNVECFPAFGTQIRIGPLTNSIGGGAATNDVIVYAVGNTANADGSYSVQGLPKRLHLAADGSVTNYFEQNNYIYTNKDIGMALGFGGFPQDAGPTVYNASDWLIPGKFGGLNFFVVRNFTNGTGSITFNAITNALGFQPASLTQLIASNTAALMMSTNLSAAERSALLATNVILLTTMTNLNNAQTAALIATNNLLVTALLAERTALNATNAQLLAAIAATNTANLIITTNLAAAERAALIATNTAILTTATNLSTAERAALLATNAQVHADIAATNTANLIITTNLVNAERAALIATNTASLTTATNLSAAERAALNATNALLLAQITAGGGTNSPARAGTNTTVVNISGTNVISADVSHAEVAAVQTFASGASNTLAALIISGTNASYVYAAAQVAALGNTTAATMTNGANQFTGKAFTVHAVTNANGDVYFVKMDGSKRGGTSLLALGAANANNFVGNVLSGTHTNTTYATPGLLLEGLANANTDVSAASSAPILGLLGGLIDDTQIDDPIAASKTTPTLRRPVAFGAYKTSTTDPEWYGWFTANKDFNTLSNFNSGRDVIAVRNLTTATGTNSAAHIAGGQTNEIRNFTVAAATNVPAAGVQSGNLAATVTNTAPVAASQLTGTISTNRLPLDQIEFSTTNGLASGAHTTVGTIATHAFTEVQPSDRTLSNVAAQVSTPMNLGGGTNLPFAGLDASARQTITNLSTAERAALNATNDILVAAGATLNSFTTNATSDLTNRLNFVQAIVGKDTNTLITAGFGNSSMNGTNRWSGSALTNLNGVAYISNGLFTVSGVVLYLSPSGYLVGNTLIATNSGGTVGTTRFATNGLAAGGDITATTVDGVTTFVSSNGVVNAANIGAAGGVTISNFPVSRIVTNTYNLHDFGTDGKDFEVFNHALAVTTTNAIVVGWGNFNQNHSNALIAICGADTNRGNWITSITSVDSPTQIHVAAAVPFSYTYQYADTNIQKFNLGYPIVAITNSSHVAMQAAVNQRTNGLNCVLDLGPGYYALTNAPQFTNQNNCQIIIPSPSLATRTNDINNAPVFVMQGAGPIAPGFYTSSGELSFPKNATVIFSTWKGDGWKGTNRMAFSVFNFTPFDGTSVGNNRSDASLKINAVKPVLKNFWLYQEYDVNGVGINAQGTFEPELHDVLIGCFMYPWFCPEPVHTNGWAFLGGGDYCGNGATSTHCQFWGYNSLVDLGIGNFVDCTFGVAHNAFTSVIGGSTAENHIRNAQFTCINKWIAGSGPICDSGDNAANGTLPNFLSATPKVTVNSYQNEILPGATPVWMNTHPAPVYDRSNYVCNANTGARAGWIEYPNISQAGLGAVPVQGVREGLAGVANVMNFFALPYQGSTNTDSRNKIWTGSQRFENAVTFTNNVTYTNGTVSMNGGNNQLQLNGYLGISGANGIVMPSGGGDAVVGSVTSGNTKWSFGVRNAGDLLDPSFGDWWFHPQTNGVNSTAGINGVDGRAIVFRKNGDVATVGSVIASNGFVGPVAASQITGTLNLTNIPITYPLTPANVVYDQTTYGYSLPKNIGNNFPAIQGLTGSQAQAFQMNINQFGKANAWQFNPYGGMNSKSNYIATIYVVTTNSCTLTGNLLGQFSATDAASYSGQLNLWTINVSTPTGTNISSFSVTNTGAVIGANKTWTSATLILDNIATSGNTTNIYYLDGCIKFY